MQFKTGELLLPLEAIRGREHLPQLDQGPAPHRSLSLKTPFLLLWLAPLFSRFLLSFFFCECLRGLEPSGGEKFNMKE